MSQNLSPRRDHVDIRAQITELSEDDFESFLNEYSLGVMDSTMMRVLLRELKSNGLLDKLKPVLGAAMEEAMLQVDKEYPHWVGQRIVDSLEGAGSK